MGALTEVPRLLGRSPSCAPDRCSPTDQREPLSRWAALSCVAQRLPWACGTVSETFMLHALIFFGAHAALLVVVLLVG